MKYRLYEKSARSLGLSFSEILLRQFKSLIMQFLRGLFSKMKAIKDQRMVFIFDECHRSQFGDTHKNIVNYFQSNYLVLREHQI